MRPVFAILWIITMICSNYAYNTNAASCKQREADVAKLEAASLKAKASLPLYYKYMDADRDFRKICLCHQGADGLLDRD